MIGYMGCCWRLLTRKPDKVRRGPSANGYWAAGWWQGEEFFVYVCTVHSHYQALGLGTRKGFWSTCTLNQQGQPSLPLAIDSKNLEPSGELK